MRLAGTRVAVAGLGVTGPSAARALAARGAAVTALDAREGEREVALAAELTGLGVEVVIGAAGTALCEAPAGLLDRVDLVLTSPGWRPDHPLLAAAARRGLPVWGDVELAWRLRRPGQPWLGVTGTNGKTTTVQMLESILRAAGHRAVACGNVGLPVLDAVLDPEPYDVLAVEMSSFQLHWTDTVEFVSAVVLNIAPDHLDWHGSFAAYAEAKASIWRADRYCIFNADDPVVRDLVARHRDRQDFSLAAGDRHCFGLVDDVLVDRCFGSAPDEVVELVDGVRGGIEVARVADVRPPAPHNIANALAAAALARALESGTGGRLPVPPAAVAAGLRSFVPGGHRIAEVARRAGVTYIDDSKATNPHAAAASLRAFDSVVWVAGGLAKGATFDALVPAVADRLRAVVLIGRDRGLIAAALARHAPDVPVVEVDAVDTGTHALPENATAPVGAGGAVGAAVMAEAVRAAIRLAEPGDTVLLAPACASMDQFRDYAARGDAFAAAARALPDVPTGS